MQKVDLHIELGESDYDPYDFVDAVVYAERLGFRTAWLGDHFLPWSHAGNRAAFVWPVLSAALEKTQHIRLGPLVTTPIGGRYHPALIAQASATIDNMYPGRFILGIGTGEAVNERPFFKGNWPKWQDRIERLSEGLTLMRQLWTSPEPFDFKGDYFPSDFYYLYTKPKTHIPVYFSAVGKKTAYCAGKLGAHLITINRETTMRRLREEIIPAFREGCREANKDVGEIAIGVSLTLKKPQEVWESSRKSFGFIVKDSWSLKTPVEVDRQGEALTIPDLMKAVHFCDNWDSVIDVIQDYRRLGATSIILSTGLDKSLMKDYGDNLLPAFQ